MGAQEGEEKKKWRTEGLVCVHETRKKQHPASGAACGYYISPTTEKLLV